MISKMMISQKRDSGLKSNKKGYGIAEVIVYLGIDSILLLIISTFILFSVKFIGFLKKGIIEDLNIYQGVSYIDHIIDVNNINSVKQINNDEYIFDNDVEPDKGFVLLYKPKSQSLVIQFNTDKRVYNNVIKSGIKNMNFILKGNVLYADIKTAAEKEIEKTWAVKRKEDIQCQQ